MTERKEKNPFGGFVLKIVGMIILIIIGFFVVNNNKVKPRVASEKQTASTKPFNFNSQNLLLSFGDLSDNIKSQAGQILGVATKTVNQTVNNVMGDAVGKVEDKIFKNTVGKVIEQIKKLPKKQQDEIKKQICN